MTASRHAIFLLVAAIVLAGAMGTANSSFSVQGINTTVQLYPNTTGHVTEIINISVSNQSVSQYSTDRVALNLTLSDWQSLVGPQLVEHIINPKSSSYGFHFIPGPMQKGPNGNYAYLLLSYNVPNVTTLTRTGPRTFAYAFSPSVFNFEHGASGQVLPYDTTLQIILPAGSQIQTVYPIPDYPTVGFTNGYKNVTSLLWFNGEPLSKFTLRFTITESLSSEVSAFFLQLYGILGIWTYVIVAVAIVLFVTYTYLRAR